MVAADQLYKQEGVPLLELPASLSKSIINAAVNRNA